MPGRHGGTRLRDCLGREPARSREGGALCGEQVDVVERDGDGLPVAAEEARAVALVRDAPQELERGVRAMPRPSPFLLHGWIEAWARHYVPDGDLRIQVAERGGKLVGAVPLYVRRRRGLRVAEFLGGDQAALADLLLSPHAPPGVAS